MLTQACVKGSVPVPIASYSKLARTKDLPLDDMQATGSFHNSRNLAWLQCKGSLLKRLLHISFAKVAQVASLASTAAVGFGDSQFGQRLLFGFDDLLVVYLDDLPGLGLGTGDLVLRGE